MRKARGQPLVLWLMLVETKSLKPLFVHGPGLGQAEMQSLGQWWLSLPRCLAVVGPRWAPCQTWAALWY